MINKMASEKKEEKNEKKETKTLESLKKRALELAEQGLTAEKIGEKLRKEGYHTKEFNVKLSKILGNRYVNPDKKNLEEKLRKIEKHCEKNKGDKRAFRDKDRLIARLRKIKKSLKLE
jgi:ribosomal protein S15P/S13E